VHDYISLEDEEGIVGAIDAEEKWDDTLKRRRVVHYGLEFDYSLRRAVARDSVGSIPTWCHQFIGRAIRDRHFQFYPDQITVNEYLPGNGIPPHVDTHSAFENLIASLSLLSDTVMSFTHRGGDRVDVVLPHRSLLLMKDEGRYDWEHSIADRKTDVVDSITVHRGRRVSVTFRKVRVEGLQCDCAFPSLCDTAALLAPPHQYSHKQLVKIGAVPKAREAV
jgi:alkylated DNA repair protein alkB family protein 8